MHHAQRPIGLIAGGFGGIPRRVIAGFVGDVAVVKRIGAPIMDTAILLGLAMAADRLRASDLRTATAS